MEMTAQEVAELVSSSARTNYDRDGYVVPNVHLLRADGSGAILLPNSEKLGDHPTDSLPRLVAMASPFLQPRYIVSVVEGWYKAVAALEDLEGWERGRLQAEAETNPDVRTAVMVVVIDTADTEASYSISAVVDGDPRDKAWEVEPFPGLLGGALAEALLHGYYTGIEEARRDGLLDVLALLSAEEGWWVCLDQMGQLGAITAAILTGGAE
jgi:hypothetical protein